MNVHCLNLKRNQFIHVRQIDNSAVIEQLKHLFDLISEPDSISSVQSNQLKHADKRYKDAIKLIKWARIHGPVDRELVAWSHRCAVAHRPLPRDLKKWPFVGHLLRAKCLLPSTPCRLLFECKWAEIDIPTQN